MAYAWWDILEAAKEKSYTDEELETVSAFLTIPILGLKSTSRKQH